MIEFMPVLCKSNSSNMDLGWAEELEFTGNAVNVGYGTYATEAAAPATGVDGSLYYFTTGEPGVVKQWSDTSSSYEDYLTLSSGDFVYCKDTQKVYKYTGAVAEQGHAPDIDDIADVFNPVSFFHWMRDSETRELCGHLRQDAFTSQEFDGMLTLVGLDTESQQLIDDGSALFSLNPFDASPTWRRMSSLTETDLPVHLGIKVENAPGYDGQILLGLVLTTGTKVAFPSGPSTLAPSLGAPSAKYSTQDLAQEYPNMIFIEGYLLTSDMQSAYSSVFEF